MKLLDEFLKIAKVKGVDKYILLDNRGKILACTMLNPGRTSHMIFSCGRNISAIGKSNFKYAVFFKKNQKNIFIFPVGNHTLGVIKQKNIENQVLVDAVLTFFNTFLKKKGLYKGENS